jgi:hypothetical protein
MRKLKDLKSLAPPLLKGALSPKMKAELFKSQARPGNSPKFIKSIFMQKRPAVSRSSPVFLKPKDESGAFWKTSPIVRRVVPISKAEMLKEYDKAKCFKNIFEIPEETRSKIIRSGVIPYTVPKIRPSSSELFLPKKTQIFFAVGIDSAGGEITDCGGLSWKREKLEQTAARELYEESMGIFDIRDTPEVLLTCPIVANGDTCIFFWRTPLKYSYLSEGILSGEDALAAEFLSRRRKFDHCVRSPTKYPEMSKRKIREFTENSLMYWISKEEFSSLVEVRTRRVFPRKFHASKVLCSSPSTKILAEIFEDSKTSTVPKKQPFAQLEGFADPPTDPLADQPFSIVHPHVYEKIRRILFPTLEALCDLL